MVSFKTKDGKVVNFKAKNEVKKESGILGWRTVGPGDKLREINVKPNNS